MEYFELARSTYIENWPDKLNRLSLAQVDIPLTRIDALAMGLSIMEWAEGFRQYLGHDDITEVKHGPLVVGEATKHLLQQARERYYREIHKALGKFPKGAFIRLGSRSPKDSWWAHKNGFCIKNVAQAKLLLQDSSERLSDDLHMALQNDYEPHLFVREWLDFKPWQEFRCFVKGRRLIGVSQYNYGGEVHFPEVKKYADTIKWAIQHFHSKFFLKAIHLKDVVFDVVVFVKERGDEREVQVKLLEINPFGEWTDPCLFDWRKKDEWKEEFRYTEENGDAHCSGL